MKNKAMQLLAVLGKRTMKENGDSQFTRVQVSTAEEPLIINFVKKGLADILEKIAPCVFGYVEDEENVSFKVSFLKWNKSNDDGMDNVFASKVEDYCSSVAIADYLSLYFPQQAQFFKDRAFNILSSIISICYAKRPDITRESYFSSTSGDVIVDNW